MSYDPHYVESLVEMGQPENADELQQCNNAVNWMRTALPNLGEVEAPWKRLLKEYLRY